MTQTTTLEPPVPPSAVKKRGQRFGKPGRAETRTAAWMIAPAVVLIITFLLIPIALTFALAFTNAKLVSPEPITFIGIDNFTRMFQDPVFWKSLRNTILFAVFVVPIQAGIALGLALLINVKIKGVNFFRTVYFLPVVTSMVVISLLWQFMYQPDGLINSFLRTISGGAIQGTDWLGNPTTALAAILFMSVWQGVGFHMIIWLSGLQTISADLYEASSLDGASNWQNFRYVTWPSLRQTRTFILVTITISAFSLFTQIRVMTQGGPLDSTTTVVFQAVRAGYDQQQTAYASAISLVFFVLVLAVALVQNYLTRDKDVKK